MFFRERRGAVTAVPFHWAAGTEQTLVRSGRSFCCQRTGLQMRTPGEAGPLSSF